MSDEPHDQDRQEPNDTFGRKPTFEGPSAGPESTPTENWVGAELSEGRYRVTERLGEGGMGTVYRAEDTKLGRDVVVKVPHLRLLAVPGFAARFAREIRALVSLEHAHVCPILDVGESGGVPFAVMRYLPGGSVEDLRARASGGRPAPMMPEDLFPWLEHIAEALDFVHREGHVHRDVKPSNILFDVHGNVYLSDFGIAKALGQIADSHQATSLTGSGVVPGTPEYTAPEVAMGQPYDGHADQYALAVMVYELLSGRRPFEGPTPQAIAVQQASTTSRPLNQVDASIPAAISTAVLRALSKNPRKRYRDCTGFVQALVASVAPHRPTASTEQSTTPRLTTAASGTGPSQPCAGGPVAGRQHDDRTTPTPNVRPIPVADKRYRGYGRWVPLFLFFVVSMAVRAYYYHWLPRNEYVPFEPVERETITNSIGMKLVLIPAGKFMMGSPVSEEDRADDEKQHGVWITKPFYLGVYEVTQEQYERVMGENPSYFSSTGGGKDRVAGRDTRNHPVEMVSWNDAAEFCRKLSAQEGWTYRLPTEAEWECACRAGTATRYYFGDGAAYLDGYAWFSGKSGNTTQRVGRKMPNAWGLCDMHGNVWEWCEDWYDADYYANSPVHDPQGPSSGSHRVYRGGSWYDVARNCRSAARYDYAPGIENDYLGFRVALVPVE